MAENFFAQFDEEQSSPLGPEESEGVFKEFGEGVISGLTKIPQGILELGATGVDLVAGTDTAGEITEGFEYLRGGVDPVGFVGKGKCDGVFARVVQRERLLELRVVLLVGAQEPKVQR